ncbi:porin [Selenihalanaerobacter shriftii]|uniref:Porin n=1 Tax=Selenihalanaerobacter shriftii TaxID=142842 RepID=A0A1T4JJD7_9FIRM|nr:porin [Selenihalanaerobacter shriftii]SJZ30261.1 porin [Selenihalanaerobacter shriftii]
MKKLSIALALVLVVALAAPAMAIEYTGGFLEVENVHNMDSSKDSGTGYDMYLTLEDQVDDQTSFYALLRVDQNFGNDDGADSNEFLRKGWVNIENVAGPLALRVGRMDEAAAGNYLYDMELKYEFARLAADLGNLSFKAGHNLDDTKSDNKTTGNDKVIFFEAKATDLGLVNGVTLNYVEDGDDYDGYSIAFNKNHDSFTADLVYGDVDVSNTSADLLDVKLATDKLFPGITASVEYADVEEEFVVGGKFQDDSVLADTNLTGKDDVEMIKPAVNFDLTDKLNVNFAYAMYEADNLVNDGHDYLDLTFAYDLTEKTLLEVEYEDNDYDDDADDNETLSTTLTAYF